MSDSRNENSIKPAIVIVGYNRPHCVARLMKSVEEAFYPVGNIQLIISLDLSDKTEEIEKAVLKIGWTHGDMIIIRHNNRLGLKEHILKCGKLSEKYGAVIILEDDLFVSKDFYSYTLQMLDYYGDDERICGVSLYTHSWNGYANYQFIPQKNEYDVFLGQIGVSWGQCWTDRQWKSFEKYYGKNKKKNKFGSKLPWTINLWGKQSWAKYFYDYMVEEDKYYVMPYTSLSTNFSESGTHNENFNNTFQVMISGAEGKQYLIPGFEKQIRIDMFFERIFDSDEYIAGISASEICVNLNGFRNSACGKKYVLTCKEYVGVTPERKFGLRLRPIEQNVIKEISGEDIFLYQTKFLENMGLSNYKKTSWERIGYEIYGNPLRRLNDFCEWSEAKNKTDILSKKIWHVKDTYSIVQESIQKRLNSEQNTGYTWMLHSVLDNISYGGNNDYSIKKDTLENLIVYMKEKGYNYERLDRVMKSKSDRNIFLTFDDGYYGVYEYVMPICERYEIPFSIFVTIDYLDKEDYLSTQNLIDLSKNKLCTICAHTLSHPILRYLSDESIKKEIISGKRQLERIINKEVEYFAYPYGSVFAVDERCIKTAKEAGFKMAFSTINSHNVTMEEARFFLPRINIDEKKALVIISRG